MFSRLEQDYFELESTDRSLAPKRMLFVCSCNVCLKVPQDRKVQASVLFTVILIYCWSWRHCISPGLKNQLPKNKKSIQAWHFRFNGSKMVLLKRVKCILYWYFALHNQFYWTIKARSGNADSKAPYKVIKESTVYCYFAQLDFSLIYWKVMVAPND